LVTGVLDAFSYLALGHVFVANMTGNVVFVAFAIAGARGFSLAASLVALAAFSGGALIGGRVGHRFGRHRGRLLAVATAVEATLMLAGFVCAQVVAQPFIGSGRYALIVLLSLAMGSQNATARRLAVPDLTTTVLTQTLTGLSADGRVAGGNDSKIGRRLLSVGTMFLGALLGAIVVLRTAVAIDLAVTSGLVGLICVRALWTWHSTLEWTQSK
jgi:uncharacterized membrane protein YoaK (UPF0700 family)